MLATTRALRYVTPLREGGSLPGIVEAEDEGTWVIKFRGAGQGVKVLAAEIIVAGIASALGIRVPELALIELPEQIAKYEADEEVQDLLTASIGLNLGMDYLPGAFNYDGTTPPPPHEAAEILWLDAFVANIDRTPHNPNLLRWGRKLWVIDHGAALYFHHTWPSRTPDPSRFAAQPFDDSSHILREVATDVSSVQIAATQKLTGQVLYEIVADVPDEWLETTADLPDADAVRAMYVAHLQARLAAPAAWLPENRR
ncbi:HipA family kinase [Yimella sp. cx-51]|uniref:HipA family kinase n=1 Tax=Yimella sp. cx-51 TaxID=2770551 RepID=UPI00165E80AF|nr:HipA family kinase [Yimella sp. cx-51]MBC9957383.1 aminotransferase class I and II [Yimella sp. cx-51]QTH39376.1 aminotransferase class I and II [Yimella sp. cx-51]